ncbi:hypothetical protein [Saccharothrix syringae]|uniref:Uncharacterized protein n=1 Tax=Saccharothrix syringae TaxID=103733 RepID=A0A5Q0H2H3_SACSY|nr:hypothetical protein [Saccharothrix syringae]QFZ20313.1 hypothetical protein EKG83_25415 [Saccharothrix syringae]
MIVSLSGGEPRAAVCLPLPAVLVRAAVFVFVFVFVLVLLRRGYDVPTSLGLVSGLVVVAVWAGYGVSRPQRALPLVHLAR